MTAEELEKANTKQVLLEVSLELFAQKGYEGVSVREIASAAHVNVAAINYHFKGKSNLYWAVMNESHRKLQEKIEALAKDSEDIEELVVKTFHFACSSRALFRNTLKLMLNDEVPAADEEYQFCGSRDQDGPPGAPVFAQVLKREISEKVSEEDLRWAVHSIFGVFFHWATICSTSKFEQLRVCHEHMRPERIERSLRRTVRAIRQSLKY